MRKLLIVTLENDLHARIIAHRLRAEGDWQVFIVEAERFAAEYLVEFSVHGARIFHSEWDEELVVETLDFVWWRRSRADQRLDVPYADAAHADLVNQDCRSTIRGVLAAHFGGTWISDPWATEAASLKPLQLRVARDVGLLIPRTLISNHPAKVREFVDGDGTEKIIKPVAGTLEKILYTQPVHDLSGISDESIAASPAIYQECITGTAHLRIVMFGEFVHCTEIYSTELDWRANLTEGLRTSALPDVVVEKLRLLLTTLNLKMGIIDMKLSATGEYHFFEINPQGQFLFVQGITGADLAGMFCRFLESLPVSSGTRRQPVGQVSRRRNPSRHRTA